jgi:16S rRNA (uracil1498-N3)-methyltransferase
MMSNLISVKAMEEHYKHPRLHVDQSLGAGRSIVLDAGQSHYLHTVLRKNTDDMVRLFNDRNGEWLSVLHECGKKSVTATCEKQIRTPHGKIPPVHLLFPPLAKDRLDFLIEKAVELGATDLHPVITARTEIRKINEARIRTQIIEAAEQCERLDIPALHPIDTLGAILARWKSDMPIYAALERSDAQDFRPGPGECALLIGPPGGFTEDEKHMLGDLPFIRPVTLGPRILRSETAALTALGRL